MLRKKKKKAKKERMRKGRRENEIACSQCSSSDCKLSTTYSSPFLSSISTPSPPCQSQFPSILHITNHHDMNSSAEKQQKGWLELESPLSRRWTTMATWFLLPGRAMRLMPRCAKLIAQLVIRNTNCISDICVNIQIKKAWQSNETHAQVRSF